MSQYITTRKLPKVSIIVPIYNVEPYLSRCMDSLLGQTLEDIEIIMIDDESPDNCPRLCDDYAARDSRIKVLHKKNGGLGYARNSGLDIATGQYVAFLDSDDFVDLDMYEILYKTAVKHDLDTVYSGCTRLDDNLKTTAVYKIPELELLSSPDEIHNVILNMIATEPSNPIERKYEMSTCFSIYSRELIEKYRIRFLSERKCLSEDIIFNMDYLSKAQNLAFVPQAFYYYCHNGSSLTRTFRDDSFERQKKLYYLIENRLKAMHVVPSLYKTRLDKFFIGYIKFNLNRIAKADIPYFRKRLLVREMCDDPILDAMDNFPIKEMPLKQRIIFSLIRNQSINSLLLLYRWFRS
ncbi:glycosyltransferase [Maribacter sp. TH_r10]|uniref:glycosyltransferase n=1 Tax=Maribacter sp. TH_r10 TaxID=3082086 RepID=UPI002953FD80|nr:glycosyltransferase [Maribacter sp. TH_r10]MDV7140116.1 glycosyltransferase [Maribacter sp. TH_r10]